MDLVPFSLFFMLQLSYQENVMGKPASESEGIMPWPKECEGQNYCNVKPNEYPSTEKIIKLFRAQAKDFKYIPPVIDTGDNIGDNVCRHYEYFVDNVYMIRDESDDIRYALHIPGEFEIGIHVRLCKPNASKLLDQVYKDNGMKCEQEYIQYSYVVLSHDQKSLEVVKIKGLPSFCKPVL